VIKILVADDNAFYRRHLETTLQSWGHQVLAAANGGEAWERITRDRPQIAILDWMMPGADGLELCRRVRAQGGDQPIYVILLTAKNRQEDVVTGLRSGADDFVCKPFNPEELQARLNIGLRIARLQANLADRVHELEYALSASRKLETMGKLAGGVAHDFNNLLTVLLGGCEFLRDEAGLSAPGLEMCRMMKGAGDRAAALAQQLLAFGRRQVLEPVPLRLNELIRGLRDLLRRTIPENITLELRLDPSLGEIRADRTQIEQVLMNLVFNGRDAIAGAGTLTVETAPAELAAPLPGTPDAVRPGRYCVVRVRDTGSGMTEEVRQRIFEPFFTTKAPGRGTGLGLATVYGIVKQSGGFVRVESAPGAGSTFAIYLPWAEARAAAPDAEFKAAGPPPGAETILVVEDEDEVRGHLRRVLRDSRYTVLEARDGEEGLSVSERWPGRIHLLLTDVVMPRLDGPRMAERMRRSRPSMKVLFMSGHDDELLDRAGPLGPHFLQKPFAHEALARKVREMLDD
jgi:two-component system cell cycle sensor histidine kinase/response regulator CckA